MTAIVKHISVHPKFRYARRVGIFDELDKREAEAKRKQNAKRQQNKMVSYGYSYAQSPFTPPEK
ncbi:hypothetical protein MPK67_gp220 [Erwinia phage pEa_SNUABM_32]|uniref:Uncharacterized protein n=2 Tax=Alexandravirus TaxID=2733088 RepID=A0AAE8C055_9CAUD|nr:hypothetical protein MPK67_gp220 [Erwinia phage pEa_SNUABM_32]YP_010302675.1 hypothetical protein MPK72_gp216 [Erwinia phage pEa_SNUABM_17]QZE57093.1 hypothetical protein pEaSNUABM32_00220 [Erwinia phage pEa_SNUABM_32]QZE57762.1 hypothetical protein pEaSNUABM17_00216 [Erwinia phage pEa_SNUABM_17]